MHCQLAKIKFPPNSKGKFHSHNNRLLWVQVERPSIQRGYNIRTGKILSPSLRVHTPYINVRTGRFLTIKSDYIELLPHFKEITESLRYEEWLLTKGEQEPFPDRDKGV